MPVPTRLANDGWWLCDRPSVALVCNISLQPGSADMTDFTTPVSNAGPAPESTFAVKPALAALCGKCCPVAATTCLAQVKSGTLGVAPDDLDTPEVSARWQLGIVS